MAYRVFEKMFPGELKVRTDDQGVVQFDNDELGTPDKVMEAFGLCGPDGVYVPYDDYGAASLAGHNDMGRSFASIADLIESEPEGLFVKGT